MMDTTPRVAVTTLLHERAIAIAISPTRGSGACGGIPASQLGPDHLPVCAADTRVLFAPDRAGCRQNHICGVDHPARGAPVSLHLHDRGRDLLDNLGDLI
jgi:hypothetical protein